MIYDPNSTRDEMILSALREAGVVPARQVVRLQRHPLNFNRRDTKRRISFRVWAGEKTLFHLTVGPALKKLHQLSSAFAQANPDIACQSLFYFKHATMEFWGQEYFGEFNLDEGLASRRIDEVTWRNAVTLLHTRLASTARPSTVPQQLHELHQFEQRLLATEWFAHLDQAFLHEAIFPLIRHGLNAMTPHRQWTNGDFIAKNILCDGKGGYRLIDCEFAAETHFADNDWFQLERFSLVPPSLDLTTIPGFKLRPPWFEMYCWLQHALRLSETCVPSITGQNLQLVAGHLTRLLAAESTFAHRSLFIGALEKERQVAALPAPASAGLELEWSRRGTLKDLTKISQPLKDRNWNELSFTLNPSDGRSLMARLRPPAAPAILDLRAVELRDAANQNLIWSAAGPDLAALLGIEGNAICLPSSEGLRFVHFGGETILTLPLLDLGQFRDSLRLSIWVHYTPTVAEFSRQLRLAMETGQPSLAFEKLTLLESPNRLPLAAEPVAQLFLPLNGRYIEDDSIMVALPATNAWTLLEYNLPVLPEASILRFDPTNQPGLLEIDRIHLILPATDTSSEKKLVLFDASTAHGTLQTGGDCLALNETTPPRFVLFGNDPILLLPALPKAVAGRTARLVVSLYYTPQVAPAVWTAALAQERRLILQNTQKQAATISLQEELGAAGIDLAQARAAETEAKISLGLAQTELLAARSEGARLAADLARAHAAETEAKTGLGLAQTELLAARSEGARLAADLAQTRAIETEAKTSLGLAQTELLAARSSQVRLQAELTQATSSATEARTSLDHTLRELANLRDSHSARETGLIQARELAETRLAQISSESGSLAAALTDLRSQHNSLIESLQVQNAALHNYKLRSGYVAKEMEDLQRRVEQGEITAAKLSADLLTYHEHLAAAEVQHRTEQEALREQQALAVENLNQVRQSHARIEQSYQAKLSEVDQLLQRVTAQYAEATTRAETEGATRARLETELADLHQRTLVRFDAVWRKNKTPGK